MAPPSNLFELLDDNGNGDAAPVVKKEEPKKAPPAPAGKDGAPPAAPQPFPTLLQGLHMRGAAWRAPPAC
jgi:hypothetical protein